MYNRIQRHWMVMQLPQSPTTLAELVFEPKHDSRPHIAKLPRYSVVNYGAFIYTED